MKAEREHVLEAAPYERTEARKGHANLTIFIAIAMLALLTIFSTSTLDLLRKP